MENVERRTGVNSLLPIKLGYFIFIGCVIWDGGSAAVCGALFENTLSFVLPKPDAKQRREVRVRVRFRRRLRIVPPDPFDGHPLCGEFGQPRKIRAACLSNPWALWKAWLQIEGCAIGLVLVHPHNAGVCKPEIGGNFSEGCAGLAHFDDFSACLRRKVAEPASLFR